MTSENCIESLNAPLTRLCSILTSMAFRPCSAELSVKAHQWQQISQGLAGAGVRRQHDVPPAHHLLERRHLLNTRGERSST